MKELKLFRSEGGSKRKKVGVEDVCGNGCLMLGDIRVPFPDCPIHAVNDSNMVSLES